MSGFQFKPFFIRHSHSAMKVGTDGIVLGVLAPLKNVTKVLDIGAGSGVVSAIIATRLAHLSNNHFAIDAVELDEGAVKDCSFNFANHPQSGHLKVHQGAIQSFSKAHKYDLVVSNPPFFENALKAATTARNHARHTDSLPFKVLAKAFEAALAEQGRAVVILPKEAEAQFTEHMAECGLYLNQVTDLKESTRHPIKRWVGVFSRIRQNIVRSELVLRNNDGQYSDQYTQLAHAFYLKMPTLS